MTPSSLSVHVPPLLREHTLFFISHLAACVQRSSHANPTTTQQQRGRQLDSFVFHGGGNGCGILTPLVLRSARRIPECGESELFALGQNIDFGLGSEEGLGIAHEHKEECSDGVRYNRPGVGFGLQNVAGDNRTFQQGEKLCVCYYPLTWQATTKKRDE